MKNAFFAPETENEHFCRDTKCHFDMEAMYLYVP